MVLDENITISEKRWEDLYDPTDPGRKARREEVQRYFEKGLLTQENITKRLTGWIWSKEHALLEQLRELADPESGSARSSARSRRRTPTTTGGSCASCKARTSALSTLRDRAGGHVTDRDAQVGEAVPGELRTTTSSLPGTLPWQSPALAGLAVSRRALRARSSRSWPGRSRPEGTARTPTSAGWPRARGPWVGDELRSGEAGAEDEGGLSWEAYNASLAKHETEFQESLRLTVSTLFPCGSSEGKA